MIPFFFGFSGLLSFFQWPYIRDIGDYLLPRGILHEWHIQRKCTIPIRYYWNWFNILTSIFEGTHSLIRSANFHEEISKFWDFDHHRSQWVLVHNHDHKNLLCNYMWSPYESASYTVTLHSIKCPLSNLLLCYKWLYVPLSNHYQHYIVI